MSRKLYIDEPVLKIFYQQTLASPVDQMCSARVLELSSDDGSAEGGGGTGHSASTQFCRLTVCGLEC